MLQNRILIIGRVGQVGWELRHKLACLGEVVSIDYPEIDFTRLETLRDAVSRVRPQVIVNAAAYTAVDKAETAEDLALAINGTAPGVLAEEAAKLGALLVHYSTDYVFNGTGSTPWLESSTPGPLNAYGRTKLAGDQAIQASGCHHLIFRTSWVYGARGNNFLLTMLRLAKERKQLGIVDDQFGAPTTSECIAQATADVLSQCLAPTGPGIEGRSGVYNLTNGGETSWYGFAREIFAQAQTALKTEVPDLNPVATSAFPRPAVRPTNSRLSSRELCVAFGVQLPNWEQGLALVIETLAENTAN
jgi:dTDP-4-dehydrorhamnose reductase